MAFDTDPYRTLGLERGATLAEVKQAYRRLAKINHPDAAGEAALPRFLAIQAAYDQIAGPAGRARPGSGGAASEPRRPWSADPERAGATYRAYGGRAGRARAAGGPGGRSGTGAGARPGPRPGGGARPGSAGRPAGGAGRAAGPGADTGARRPPRPPNKATLGSTSYDGADGEPYEPDWGGASWYGTTSGTYWTLNPKEYADPRKHGPEYQMRGRRRRAGEEAVGDQPLGNGRSDAVRGAGTAASDAGSGSGEPDVARASAAPGAEAPTHTATSWWEARAAANEPGTSAGTPPGTPAGTDAGRGPDPTATRPRPAPGARPGPGRPARPRSGDARRTARPSASTAPASATTIAADPILAAIRGWLDDPRPSPVSRIGRAVLGWVPLALAIGWVAGESSGCARFAADCDPSVAPMTWLVQILALGVLIVVAPAARIATTAAIATLLAVVPGAILLLATSDPAAIEAGRVALGVLMAVAWIGGSLVGLAREGRRLGRHVAGRAAGGRTAGAGPLGDGPVS